MMFERLFKEENVFSIEFFVFVQCKGAPLGSLLKKSPRRTFRYQKTLGGIYFVSAVVQQTLHGPPKAPFKGSKRGIKRKNMKNVKNRKMRKGGSSFGFGVVLRAPFDPP